MAQHIPIEDFLFNIFANPEFTDSQKYSNFWALEEIQNRLSVRNPDLWKMPRARKAHECIRGCSIHPDEYYFRYNDSFGSGIKFCATCAAMIFYFSRYHQIKTFRYDHWDAEQQHPVALGPTWVDENNIYDQDDDDG